jgi:hypothetical protein
MARCQASLKQAGAGVNMYTTDNAEKIPYLSLRVAGKGGRRGLGWDELLGSYMGTRWASTDSKATWRKDWNPTATGEDKTPQPERQFICASDRVQSSDDITIPSDNWRGVRRSYSMPQSNAGGSASFNVSGGAADPSDWPPNPKSKTGIGLCLMRSANAIKVSTDPLINTHADEGGMYNGGTGNTPRWVWRDQNSDNTQGDPRLVRFQIAVYGNVIQAPSETMFITERISAGNHYGGNGWAEIPSANAHHNNDQGHNDTTLHGRDTYNYTMLDGSVHNLMRQKTLGTKNTNTGRQSGMWTINPTD